jgi:hypothetical protein
VEASQEDGTLAHAIERIVPLAARYAGSEVVPSDLAQALGSGEASSIEAASEQLRDRLSPHGRQTEGNFNSLTPAPPGGNSGPNFGMCLSVNF